MDGTKSMRKETEHCETQTKSWRPTFYCWRQLTVKVSEKCKIKVVLINNLAITVNCYIQLCASFLVIGLLFTRHSCTGRYCWERVLGMGILSVRLSVCPSRPGIGFNARWDRDSGSSPYDSIEYLVSYEVIWCHGVRRFPSNDGIKEGYPA